MAEDIRPADLFDPEGTPFDVKHSSRFPKGFDIYKEPYEGYSHRHGCQMVIARFLDCRC